MTLFTVLDEYDALCRAARAGTLCSCGARTIPAPDRRQRMGADLLEYRPCEARCGSTTTVLIEPQNLE